MKLVTTLIRPGQRTIQWHLILCISMVLLGAIDSGIQYVLSTAESAMEESAFID